MKKNTKQERNIIKWAFQPKQIAQIFNCTKEKDAWKWLEEQKKKK